MIKVRIFLIAVLLICCQAVWADNPSIPDAIEALFTKDHPQVIVRMDGLMQDGDKLWLPLVPRSPSLASSNGAISLIHRSKDGDYLFSNAWIYTPVKDNTIKSFDFYDSKIQKQILKNEVISSFVIPEGFTLPRDLAVVGGRLPLPLRAVELASDREVVYRERLRQVELSKPLQLLSYSRTSGDLSMVEILQESVSGQGEALVTKMQDLQSQLSYVSNIKFINSDIYMVDYHRGEVSKLLVDKGDKFDATKPDTVAGEVAESYRLEKVISLTELGFKTGLQDFIIMPDLDLIYLLTNIDPKLLIVKASTKELVKSIKISPGSNGLLVSSRNASEPNKVMFISKAKPKLVTVNTLDHRIAQEVDLAKIDKQFKFIPHSFTLNENYIFVACEAISQNASSVFLPQGKILVLDAITNALVTTIDLDYIPYDLLLARGGGHLYSLGYNRKTSHASKIAMVREVKPADANGTSQEPVLKVAVEKSLDLNPDIIGPRDMIELANAGFVVVPSSGTSIMGVVDVRTWDLVHKIDIGDKSNLLVAL